jgi:RNA polymerase sigma-70 factor (ECF subfamily)
LHEVSNQACASASLAGFGRSRERSTLLTAREAARTALRADAAAPPRDGELVLAARAGDRDAFASLYERYVPLVHGVLLARVRATDVLDLVHDVFLSALRRLASLEQPEQFGPWVAAIARNLASDAHKRRRESVELGDELHARERDDRGEAEDAARALAALRELPEAYRETLVLRLVEGLTGPEIAARTGLTPGSVRVNLCRGMKLLRERLGLEEA